MKAVVISAPMTGSGKTTVTLGLLQALRNRGISVQPFKVGPDFIDPGLHALAAGAASHNLDGWMLRKETNEWLFDRARSGKQIAVLEGMMGLFDGFDGKSERGSTAEMAKWLDLPVILVIDAHAMARSAAALVHGFRSFDSALRIAGIIFNRVGGEGHYRILADAVRDVPILGWLPTESSIEIPERHLGLFTGQEDAAAARIGALGRFFQRHIEMDAVLSAAGIADRSKRIEETHRPSPRVRIAIAHDKAFSFYYSANRMALEAAGGEIVEFSPLADRELPDTDFLYIGGGYPELYRKELQMNVSMRASVRKFIDSGGKFYAECGGLMYLAQAIDGAEMVGVVPSKIEMTDRLQDFGYAEITSRKNSILGPAGTIARGHQFHYSRCAGERGDLFDVRQGERVYTEGFAFQNGLASYVHLHFLSNPAIAGNMLHSC